MEVIAEGQNAVMFRANSTSLPFTAPVLSCSPYHVRVKAQNDLGQQTEYGDRFDAYLITDTSEFSSVAVTRSLFTTFFHYSAPGLESRFLGDFLKLLGRFD